MEGAEAFDWADASTWGPALDGMDAAYIAYMPDVGAPSAGEEIAAFVVKLPDATLAEDALLAHCATRLARYKVPRRVEVVQELPANAMGKVTKFVLRERALETAGGS